MTNPDSTVELLIGALGAAAIKATIILALAALVTVGLRRRAAALKHLVWTVGLGATLVVLILPAMVPAWPVMPVPRLSFGSVSIPSAPSPLSKVAVTPPRETNNGPAAVAESSNARSGTQAGPTATSEAGWRTTVRSALGTVRWPAVLLSFWIAGLVVVVARYGWSHAVLHRLSRRSSTRHATACSVLAQQVAREMRIDRAITLLESREVELPLTWGIVRPHVVLPSEASEWTAERCRFVLQHELAHVRRLDACTQLVAQAASAIFWFHPLVWYAGRQMRHERERACDDCVLAHGAVASEYASELLALVTTYGHIERHPAALAMARRSQFEGRLLALLDPTVERGLASPRSVAVVLALAIALVVPAAALRSAETPQNVGAPTIAAEPRAVTADVPAPRKVGSAPPARPTTPIQQGRRPVPAGRSASDDLFAGCASGSSSHSSNHSDSDNNRTTWTASAGNGDCSYELKSEGSIAFTPDVSAIERISAGGYVDITTTLQGAVTRLVARSATGSDLTYEFSRNGQRADYGADGAAWLARFLVTLDRHTAFAIDRRFPMLLRDGGPSGVLDEIERMGTDHAGMLYLLRLVAGVPLDAAALLRTCEDAASGGGSHDMAEVLMAIAGRYSLADASVHAVFLKAALVQDPGYEQARVLLAFLERATPTAGEAMAILASLRHTDSDHEKCRVLVALARTQRLEGALRDAYLDVAGSLRADYDRSRALAAIARH